MTVIVVVPVVKKKAMRHYGYVIMIIVSSINTIKCFQLKDTHR